MGSVVRRWLDIHRDEVHVFVLSAAALFFLRGAAILFANFAETAFLKRFGVQYLPAIIVVNSAVTFVVMGFVGGLLARVAPARLLVRTLWLCGLSVAVARLAVPLGLDLLYPTLYVMRTQFDLLLTFLFWNLANERFSTRRSKHLFPLITAGGIVGGIVGSFGTPVLVRLTTTDDLMWVYVGVVLAAAQVVSALGRGERAPAGRKTTGRGDFSPVAELRNALPVLKASPLARLMVALAVLANVAAPFVNYQFSFAVDMTFPTEGEMLGFYGVFRGFQNVLALAVSLFAGRLYARIGIPTALLLHPANYLLVFAAFWFRFDIFTAAYAGVSVGVLRTAVQNPARTALLGLFPGRERIHLLPFLRGTAVRVGLLVGSLSVLLCQSGYFVTCRRALHPQNLSPFGVAFAAAWLWVAWQLRKRYAGILLQALGRDAEAGGLAPLPRHGVVLDEPFLAAVRPRIDRCYRLLYDARALRRGLEPGPRLDRLVDHLVAEALRGGREVLEDAAEHDPTGYLKAIRAGFDAGDARQRANAAEALEYVLDRSLARVLVPLLEDLEPADRLAAARRARYARPPRRTPVRVLEDLAAGDDPEIRRLARDLQGAPAGSGKVNGRAGETRPAG